MSASSTSASHPWEGAPLSVALGVAPGETVKVAAGKDELETTGVAEAVGPPVLDGDGDDGAEDVAVPHAPSSAAAIATAARRLVDARTNARRRPFPMPALMRLAPTAGA
jgi:hypothetical protein